MTKFDDDVKELLTAVQAFDKQLVDFIKLYNSKIKSKDISEFNSVDTVVNLLKCTQLSQIAAADLIEIYLTAASVVYTKNPNMLQELASKMNLKNADFYSHDDVECNCESCTAVSKDIIGQFNTLLKKHTDEN